MSDTPAKNNTFGYVVAAGGFLIVMLTMFLLVNKTLALSWMVLALVAAGIFVVALGMYVVYPKETKDYLDAAGNAVDHIPVPRFQRQNGDREQPPPPAVVTPAHDQTVIVKPAPETNAGVDSVQQDLPPELATEGKINPFLTGSRNTYPHGDG